MMDARFIVVPDVWIELAHMAWEEDDAAQLMQVNEMLIKYKEYKFLEEKDSEILRWLDGRKDALHERMISYKYETQKEL